MIHILKRTFTFLESHFFFYEIHILVRHLPRWGKNSHIESLIFHKIHICKISFLTEFTFQKSHFSQNSHFWNLKINGISGQKVGFCPSVCLLNKIILIFFNLYPYRKKKKKKKQPVVFLPKPKGGKDCDPSNRMSSFGYLAFVLSLINAAVNAANNINNNQVHCVWKFRQNSDFCRSEPTLILKPWMMLFHTLKILINSCRFFLYCTIAELRSIFKGQKIIFSRFR